MSLENRIKTYVVSGAVILALLGAIIPHPVHYPAPRFVPPPFVPAIMIMASPHVTVDGHIIPITSNVVLVDAKRRLYLAVAHGVETSEVALVISRKYGPMRAYAPRQWRNDLADLAIVQIIKPYDLSDIVPLPLASRLPLVGDRIVVHGYIQEVEDGELNLYPVRRPFTVVKSTSDVCQGPATCKVRDELVTELLEGKRLTRHERSLLYPHFIYAIMRAPGMGLQPGLSGSPALGPGSVIMGTASSMLIFDAFGHQGYFTPAYLALPLLARAQADIDHHTIP